MELVTAFLLTVNETLTTGNALIAVSLLLFNLTRNFSNRVAKTSAVALACVTIVYVVDSFISLGPDTAVQQTASRLQWIGIAFIPAAMYHLSDALLTTTGLPSRGRRKLVVRLLYLVGALFLMLALTADALVQFVTAQGQVSIQAGAAFALYLAYFAAANSFAFYNVHRARKRCLTQGTRRRMAYLQIALLTPALGIFPYSMLLEPGDEFSLFGLLVINTANIIVILMLLFLSYPLYFFGSDIPSRLVKKQLLDFLFRGLATGLIALALINFTTQASRIFSLPGTAFTSFAVVAAVLLWQWLVSLSLPYIEKMFIYRSEDDDQITKLQTLSEKVLTHNDMSQLIAATTESICDYLRIDQAFVISFDNGEPEFLNRIGAPNFPDDDLLRDGDTLQNIAQLPSNAYYVEWRGFALIPLFSARLQTDSAQAVTVGMLGLLNSSQRLKEEIQAPQSFLHTLLDRVEKNLDDMRLQAEMYHLLEGLLPQFQMTRSRAVQIEYRQSPAPPASVNPPPDRSELFEQVRAALRHYWGGPGITQSNLMKLQAVQRRMTSDEESPVNALRKLLEESIAALKPAGERKMASPEWTLYNILQLRFLEKKKVRDVARRLSMSEADLYRKQRVAILAVTDLILQQEQKMRP